MMYDRALGMVNCSRGAPMGRVDVPAPRDFEYKMRLYKMNLDSGGYDRGGAYWGHGEPMYCAEADDRGEDVEELPIMYLRAKSRDEAKSIVRESYPYVSFFR